MSKKIGQNDPCPCGSSKKYKKCYQSKTDDCRMYLLENHNIREEKIIKFMETAMDEITYSFSEKGETYIRAQLALAFTAIDFLSTYWDKYNNEADEKPSVSFERWLDLFCLTDENEYYRDSKYYKKASAKDFTRLRNSIVHFYSLPREQDFTLMPNNYTTKEAEDFVQKLEEKTGKSMHCVQSMSFYKLVRKGGVLMLEEMIENVKTKPQEHFEGIKRVFEEVQSRGAALIEVKNEK